MALFPAYEEAAKVKDGNETSTSHGDWLTNSSYQIGADLFTSSEVTEIRDSSESGAETNLTKRPAKKSKVRKHKKQCHDKPAKAPDDFHVDTRRNLEFLSVHTISRPAAPKYSTFFKLGSAQRTVKKKYKRYYQIVVEKKDNSADEATVTKKDLEKNISVEKNEDFTGFKQESDMSKTTAFYNKSLGENPRNIDLWLQYVHFQDAIFKFEKTYRKGSFAKGTRVTAERKLAILDKALTLNPDSEILMRERLNTAVGTYPADELQVQLKNLVEKDPANIILWQGYIEATQCSMSHCNTPAVLKLYTKSLATLHHMRRNSALQKAHLEENILRMLYQCGLFLKQTGLFEQLWTLLRLYLELNLAPSDKNKFNISSNFNDKQLLELEEVVLKSQLPIHELWLRIERLREACHWLPFTEDGNCEDPQRIIFPEDVAELIHPITMPGNMFKLTATILTLLKTPLLPSRHSTMQGLGLDYVPWALDSTETLLPMFFPIYPIDLTNKNFLADTQRLAVGPQYLKTFPGQEEYLEFLLTTIMNCTDCLQGKEKIAVTVWWFRFQRLLIVLDKESRLKISSGFKKKLKSSMKQLLKSEEHRNNIIYYQEFALFEYQSGNVESAVKILTTTLSTIATNNPPLTEMQRCEICFLFRTLTELYLDTASGDGKKNALKCLVALASDKPVNSHFELTQDLLDETKLKFKHVTLQMLGNEMPTLMSVDHFLPNLITDWIICNGWFLYLTSGAISCGTFLEDILSTIEAATWQKEILFEFYVAVLFRNCMENPGAGMFKLLDDALHRAIEVFPNNLFLLSVLAKELTINCSMGQPWWKINRLLMKTGHAIPTLVLIIMANQHSYEIREKWVDTITGREMTEDPSQVHRMISLFRRVTSSEMCTRRCGLAWRLYLQYLHAHFDLSVCRNAYYAAVEQCPWLKSLYIDAAIYIPAELAQIQDLLIEKQLRLHITPEELDILRN
ncbi:protein NRDE2 homolog [Photinus pyralis]|uniref:Protein NRDE2 homolog n=2 Tax=Photinus pyralis TaxID=7054 RepID=A0A1Y1LRH3_PHOPY|nr:protein NRDE2 homolog [Photinus pyralis]